MYFERLFDTGLAQAGYLIGCEQSGEALVIDPLRDVDRYVAAANRRQLRITHVTETHVHADFLSGARQLAELTGAELLLSDEGGPDWVARFPHTPLRDGDEITLGQVTIRALHTPGHTPEHLSFLVTDRANGQEPVMVLTGDFLFVGDVGRPDLLESAAGVAGSADQGARSLFASTRTIRELPEYVQVWPGHGAGSACGKAMGALPTSTIGYESRFNWALREQSEHRFVESVLAGQPEVPTYFGRMKRLNREGPSPFPHDESLPLLDSRRFSELREKGARVIDTRSVDRFAAGHLAGALNIPGDGSFTNWAGWLLDPDEDYLLIADPGRSEELRRALARVGIDRVVGFVENSDEAAAGSEKHSTVTSIDAEELSELLSGESSNYRVIDVRTNAEFASGHIPGATHIHLGHLPQRLDEVDGDEHVLVYCHSGTRSAIATSILLASGLERVTNLSGGFASWQQVDGAPIAVPEATAAR